MVGGYVRDVRLFDQQFLRLFSADERFRRDISQLSDLYQCITPSQCGGVERPDDGEASWMTRDGAMEDVACFLVQMRG